MQQDIIQIALAGLIGTSDLVRGADADLRDRLGEFPEGFGEIIELASRLSIGAGGAPGELHELQSIFDQVTLAGEPRRGADRHFYAPLPLALRKEVLFPRTRPESADLQAAFAGIARSIQQALPPGPVADEANVERALAVLHRLASNLPSGVLPDVSFYDHRRMTAALAVCLLEKWQAAGALSFPPDDGAALLVGGDLSGIQDFIYTIRAKGAARTLRGRSFYLQLLTEAVLRFVLRDLQLPYASVIYSGGGHFFLLAPLSREKDLAGLQKRISEILLEHHGTALYLALGSAVVPFKGFEPGQFPAFWGRMHASLAGRKRQRYGELGNDLYARLFIPAKTGGNPENTCDVCGEDHRPLDDWKFPGDEDNGKICSLCASFEDIGRKLTRSHFVALGFGAPAARTTDDATGALSAFGMTVRFVEQGQERLPRLAEHNVLWALDDPVEEAWPALDGAAKWLRYTANHVPGVDFDALQKKVQGGFERLGVLRMDVDHLGDLFKRGFGEHATLTRLATLSFRTSLFFEGWVKRLCEQGERRDSIYTVYAGGDDLFLIGPWDQIPGLAQAIVRDFSEYTGNNPDLHASAGMAFIDGKYPVYQAAEDAGDAIDESKRLEGKDAFTFLDMPWKWSDFSQISGMQNRLSSLVTPRQDGKRPAPQAILQVLQQLALEERQHEKSRGRHVWGRWIWMGMYQLTRMQERAKDQAGEIGAIRDALQGNNYQDIDQWGVAARWAQLQTRKKSKEDAK